MIPCLPDLTVGLIMAAEGTEIMRSAPEICLRLRFCLVPECRAMFFVCKRCDRGQRYCSPQCRKAGRCQQRREANSRYQRTERGLLAHLLRQRIYRQKRSTTTVTDQGSLSLAQTGPKLHPIPSRYAICQKERHWIDPFDQISPRLWKRVTKGWGGQSPTNYVFT